MPGLASHDLAGAHAQILGGPLATADADRFRTDFPKLTLPTP